MVFCRVAYAQLNFELSHVQNYMQPIGDSPQLFTLSAAVPNFPCNVKCINSEKLLCIKCLLPFQNFDKFFWQIPFEVNREWLAWTLTSHFVFLATLFVQPEPVMLIANIVGKHQQILCVSFWWEMSCHYSVESLWVSFVFIDFQTTWRGGQANRKYWGEETEGRSQNKQDGNTVSERLLTFNTYALFDCFTYITSGPEKGLRNEL